MGAYGIAYGILMGSYGTRGAVIICALGLPKAPPKATQDPCKNSSRTPQEPLRPHKIPPRTLQEALKNPSRTPEVLGWVWVGGPPGPFLAYGMLTGRLRDLTGQYVLKNTRNLKVLVVGLLYGCCTAAVGRLL